MIFGQLVSVTRLFVQVYTLAQENRFRALGRIYLNSQQNLFRRIWPDTTLVHFGMTKTFQVKATMSECQ